MWGRRGGLTRPALQRPFLLWRQQGASQQTLVLRWPAAKPRRGLPTTLGQNTRKNLRRVSSSVDSGLHTSNSAPWGWFCVPTAHFGGCFLTSNRVLFTYGAQSFYVTLFYFLLNGMAGSLTPIQRTRFCRILQMTYFCWQLKRCKDSRGKLRCFGAWAARDIILLGTVVTEGALNEVQNIFYCSGIRVAFCVAHFFICSINQRISNITKPLRDDMLCITRRFSIHLETAQTETANRKYAWWKQVYFE